MQYASLLDRNAQIVHLFCFRPAAIFIRFFGASDVYCNIGGAGCFANLQSFRKHGLTSRGTAGQECFRSFKRLIGKGEHRDFRIGR